VQDAARMMADLDVGALPICGEDNRLKGMLTDRQSGRHRDQPR
jgi:CBS domain-containing protein